MRMKIAIMVSEKEMAKGHASPYFNALAEAGAKRDELVMINQNNGAGFRADDFHGILFSGGEDVDPALYGETKKYENIRVNRERDAFELAWLERAIRSGVPVFGICRGAQLVNVKFGGTLYQDLASDWTSEVDPPFTIQHQIGRAHV